MHGKLWCFLLWKNLLWLLQASGLVHTHAWQTVMFPTLEEFAVVTAGRWTGSHLTGHANARIACSWSSWQWGSDNTIRQTVPLAHYSLGKKAAAYIWPVMTFGFIIFEGPLVIYYVVFVFWLWTPIHPHIHPHPHIYTFTYITRLCKKEKSLISLVGPLVNIF